MKKKIEIKRKKKKCLLTNKNIKHYKTNEFISQGNFFNLIETVVNL